MRRFLKSFVLSKLVSLCLIGSASGQVAKAVYCQPDVIQTMKAIWAESSNGTSGVEAAFIVNGKPEDYAIEHEHMTGERMKQTLHIYPGVTFALFHVHPNMSGEYPSTPHNNYADNARGDTGFADKGQFDIYVVSSRALVVYYWQTQEIVRLREGMSWTKNCK